MHTCIDRSCIHFPTTTMSAEISKKKPVKSPY